MEKGTQTSSKQKKKKKKFIFPQLHYLAETQWFGTLTLLVLAQSQQVKIPNCVRVLQLL
jgi:putative copper export protein